MAASIPLAQANATFSLDLLRKLSEDGKTANVFFSPFSISAALAMVMLGARGNTATQISEVLSFIEAEKGRPAAPQQMQQMQQQSPKTQHCQDDVHADFSRLLSELNKPDASYALSVANRLYGEQTYEFVEDFLGRTRKHYDAELEPVDFQTSYEAARLNINTWVEKQTQDKIKDLLAEGTVNDMTRLVLVNAIYFKSNWKNTFLSHSTKDGKFRLNKNDTKPVKMMHQNEALPFAFNAEFKFQILEMPYKGNELSMLIFLPMDIEDGSTGLEKLEKELTYENFVAWTRPNKMEHYDVQVGLPRFKIAETYDMKKVLVSMGMVDAFDMKMSDFSGMSPGNDLVLSKVIHKAFVEVDEEGTEAAAATAVTMVLTSCCVVERPRATFIADHPFLFFIRHNPSMTVLFAGRYCSPE